MKLPTFFKNNLLLKITSLNSFSIGVRALLGFISGRIIAEKFGPSGVALIGDIRNIIPMIQSFSSLGFFNGIVKYVAEFKSNKVELLKLFSTTFVFVFFASFISFVVLFFGASYWNNLLFGENQNFSFIFQLLAIASPFIAMNRIFNGIINGLSLYKKFIKIEFFTYVLGVVFILTFLYFKGLKGTLFAIAMIPILQFLILFYFFSKTLKEYLDYKEIRIVIPYKNKLFGFTIMSFVATLLGNFIEVDLRGYLKNQISSEDAGYWTAMCNLSKQYLIFFSAIFTLYIIPKFTTISSSIIFRKELLYIFRTILPLLAIGLLLIFFLRNLIIEITLGEGFLEMSSLFKWQLIGDFTKIVSMIIAHQFLAKKMVKQFIITELLSLLFFYVFARFFIKSMGVEGIVFAHFVRYVLYLLVVVIILRKHIFGKNIIS